jgi:hypothetical protein
LTEENLARLQFDGALRQRAFRPLPVRHVVEPEFDSPHHPPNHFPQPGGFGVVQFARERREPINGSVRLGFDVLRAGVCL